MLRRHGERYVRHMAFNLNYPGQDTRPSRLQLQAGEMVFILGANGTGKSSMMHLFAQQNKANVRKISAHRQTWMNTDMLDMTPSAKAQTEENIRKEETQHRSRYRDPYAAQRASMTIYELIDAENVRAREITAAVDAGDMEKAKKVAAKEAPITAINELLQQSNIPIIIGIRENERVMASKNGGPEYSAAELSDGERNAVLIAGNVLTAPLGSLLLIDEPERHLHRSIISPLLSQLFDRRSDCGFVISTHDYDLPLEVPRARTLLVRSCDFNGQNVQSWDVDELPAEAAIDDVHKRDLLGSRRKILFVEGTERSLDKPLYSIIFPMVSVVPKGSCRDVEDAVVGSRAVQDFHWLRAFGVADGDGCSQDQIDVKRKRGVYSLPYYSVESIYFHPKVIELVAELKAALTGDDGSALANSAIEIGITEVAKHTERLSRKVAKKLAREMVVKQIPSDDDLLDGHDVPIENTSLEVHSERRYELDEAVREKNWEAIITKCPVRETGALNKISSTLGFARQEDYQKTVRHLLTENEDALLFARGLFDNLFDEISN